LIQNIFKKRFQVFILVYLLKNKKCLILFDFKYIDAMDLFMYNVNKKLNLNKINNTNNIIIILTKRKYEWLLILNFSNEVDNLPQESSIDEEALDIIFNSTY